ncbi:cation diffusion facilitator family transporter [Pseudonocardia spinosispora]|uniref:cation diffusion facilitator family transporter n=1 Tax=Pseudonocardia spinosispora TaxID=103441 RepID=UPI0003F8C29C|nr:cation diffusion facilitator family transporter [Pseudonocardia spinosispora]
MSEHHGHGHSHGHGHGHGRWARVRDVLGAHSHDSADRVDDALRTSSLGLRTVGWSFGVLALTAALQLVVVAVTGSVALLGDTIHNIADALTAVPLAVAFLLGRRPATSRYTYGLGRSEDLAGVIVVLVVAASAALAGYQAIHRLLHPQPITHLWAVALAGLVGFVGNEVVARLRIRVGRRIGSAALVADGIHARTDGFTSLAVVLGAAGVALGLPLADPVIGLLISVMILFVAKDAARDVLHRLMDAVDPHSVALATRTAADVPGVLGSGRLRMRWIGHRLHAELAVAVRPDESVENAHRIAHRVEHALVHAVPRLASATVHVEPASRAAEAHDELAHHGHDRGTHHGS